MGLGLVDENAILLETRDLQDEGSCDLDCFGFEPLWSGADADDLVFCGRFNIRAPGGAPHLMKREVRTKTVDIWKRLQVRALLCFPPRGCGGWAGGV